MHANANGAATVSRVRSIRQLAPRNFVTDGLVWIVLLYEFWKETQKGLITKSPLITRLKTNGYTIGTLRTNKIFFGILVTFI
ncbi:hypothetical protein L596_000522 [Steinernema carpocapsae]|uniref:Uncharacterized protein n=1 Tax=Steinernema carpocapsae TaxID=34508 RepID=A0A4U8UKS3_STECR|nr:hypothetical protein L596_000522 [Steinernema carpocapsae]